MESLVAFFLNKPLLAYRYNPSSITSKHSLKHLSDLCCFYDSINLGVPIFGILKLKVARSLAFFQSELRVKRIPNKNLVSDVKSINLSPEVLNKLPLSDRLFYKFPGIYIFLDRYRVPLKKLFV
jgi:hypothetical protein